MTDLQPKLGEVRKLVEAKKIECPYHPILEDDSDPTRRLCSCKGTSRISDPAYLPLLEVVMTKCKSLGKPHWHDGVHYKAKDDCGQSFSRSIEGWPIGALKGAIEFAIIDIPGLWAKYVMALPRKHWRFWSNEELLDALIEVLGKRE